jgi:hypothetical protein
MAPNAKPVRESLTRTDPFVTRRRRKGSAPDVRTRPRDRDLNGGRGPYRGGTYVRKGLDMIEDNTLSDFAHRLDQWLVLAADPGTRRYERDGMVTALAELFGKKRGTIRTALHDLADRGRIKFELPQGRGVGWIEVLGYDDRLNYNARTAELRTAAYLAGDVAEMRTAEQLAAAGTTSGDQVTDSGTSSPAETPRLFCDSLGVPKRRVHAGDPRPRQLRARPARLVRAA